MNVTALPPESKTQHPAGERWVPIDSKLETPKPARTAAQIAEEEKKASEEKFPDTFAASLELLQKLSAETVSSLEDWYSKQPRLAKLRRHVHLVQQGLPTLPPSTGDEQSFIWSRHTRSASQRKTRIETLQAFLKGPEPKITPIPPFDLKEAPKFRLLKEPTVMESLFRCRKLLAEASLYELENFDLAFPDARVKEIEHAISIATDMGTLRGLQEELNRIRPFAINLTDRTAKSLIERKFEPALTEISALIGICRAFLLSWGIEAGKQEAAAFNKLGIPVQKTSLSLNIEAVERHLPVVSRTSLEWFGVGDIASE